MEADDWKELREAQKKIRAAKCQNALLDIESWLRTKSYLFVLVIQPWHFRIRTSSDNILDIFPGKKKYHDLVSGKRGEYTDVIKLLNNTFSIPSVQLKLLAGGASDSR